MGPKEGRRVRTIDVTTDSVSEFELGNAATDIHWRREEREARGREEAQQQRLREQEARGKSREHILKRRDNQTKSGLAPKKYQEPWSGV